ncbi:hypothetical protein HQ590_08550, partial [bacterium]|nr:hypothetical protein [bacterium]
MRQLGICIAGLNGAVGSTLVAGVALMRRGLAPSRALLSERWVTHPPLAGLDEIVFGGWDPRGEDLQRAALRHAVIEPHRLMPVARALRALKPFTSSGGRGSRRTVI